MRWAAVAIVVLALMVVPSLWGGMSTQVGAQSGNSSSESGSTSLIALPISGDGKGQLLSVVDPQSRTLAVYHIDAGNGEISLRCVRNLTWDLQMTEFNGKAPLPGEIRTLLEQR